MESCIIVQVAAKRQARNQGERKKLLLGNIVPANGKQKALDKINSMRYNGKADS